MEYLNINSEETYNFFVHAFEEQSIVPVLGSGFTCNVETNRHGRVPSGRLLKRKMIEKLVAANKGEEEELKAVSFSAVAEYFQSVFPISENKWINDYCRKNFTSVRIKKAHQLNFLNGIDWPYVYTLNIDTGIEDSSKKWEPFYPNRPFDDRTVRENAKCLYKIHGDIAMFCKNLNYDEMILTENQYIASLEHNKQFHDYLTADCGNRNILYIGCSLSDEIDIKFSVLSDNNKNKRVKDVRGIYVTSEDLSNFRVNQLENFNISHIIKISSIEEYEIFYEFIYKCYCDSKSKAVSSIDQFRFKERNLLPADKESNLDYLSSLAHYREQLPFYYTPSVLLKELELSDNQINVIVGRRFAGKSMLAYSLLESNPNYNRFYISEEESISEIDIKKLLEENNSIILFDSEALDEKSFNHLIDNFNPKKKNVVCIFLNSSSDVANLITYTNDIINYALKGQLVGKLPAKDIALINDKLNILGIASFNPKHKLLDNTMRIANVYNRKIVSSYPIVDEEELVLLIWVLVKSKLYYEDIVTLGLKNSYQSTIRKFSPFIQEEPCKKGEIKRHSGYKVICNGRLGLLQILSAYIYPGTDTDAAKKATAIHQDKVCGAIYTILNRFNRIDKDNVKEFLFFDKLNDVFSRTYSAKSIESLEEGRRPNNGAASIIHKVYGNSDIMRIKADDPNYWLQRAKSIYILCDYDIDQSAEINNAIDWAKKAEEDAIIKSQEGENKYRRTESNAVLQIAMLQGKMAKICKYKNIKINEEALRYYYKGFSDPNNIVPATTLITHSRGTKDLREFVTQLGCNPHCVGDEWNKEKNYLLNVIIQRFDKDNL